RPRDRRADPAGAPRRARAESRDSSVRPRRDRAGAGQGGARRRSRSAAMSRGILAGVTVLSLEQATTLPFLTYRLACDGARVIRIEHPRQPDPNRFVGQKVLPEDGMNSYFLPTNCGKEAITLNLAEPEGRAILHELVG